MTVILRKYQHLTSIPVGAMVRSGGQLWHAAKFQESGIQRGRSTGRWADQRHELELLFFLVC